MYAWLIVHVHVHVHVLVIRVKKPKDALTWIPSERCRKRHLMTLEMSTDQAAVKRQVHVRLDEILGDQ